MRFLLDTDHISILQKQSGAEYRAMMPRIEQAPPADLAFCIVSFHEQALGCNTYIAQAKTSADIVRG
jgi:tRNA(fMet)-specific endonuclease VapC